MTLCVTRCTTLLINEVPLGYQNGEIWALTTAEALDNSSSTISDIWADLTRSSSTLSRLGYVTLAPFHFDRNCVQFVATNFLFYSGCSLPPHCGPPVSVEVSTTWYGAQTLFCSATYSCPDDSVCRHDLLEHIYYSFTIPLAWAGPKYNKRGETISLFDLWDTFPSNLYYLVDHPHTSTAYIYPKECVMYSHRAKLDRSLLPDYHHMNFSAGSEKQCIDAMTKFFHSRLCNPISKYTHPEFSVRANKAILRILVFYISLKPDSDFSPFYVNLNYTIPSSPLYTNESTCLIQAWYDNRIPGVLPCEPDFYPFQQECYSVESHYSNPFALVFNYFLLKLKNGFLWIVHQIETELKFIIKWFLSVFGDAFYIILDIVLDIPMVFQFFVTYSFVWLLYKSHVISCTVAGTLWLFFSNY